MAYVSHSGSNKSSQYDWKILIFMIVLLVSILIFVAIKFLYPHLLVGTSAVPTPQVSQPVVTAQPSKVDVPAALVSPNTTAEPKDSAIVSAPKSVEVVISDAPKNSEPKKIDNTLKSDLFVEPSQDRSANELLCSNNDRAAGLCQ